MVDLEYSTPRVPYFVYMDMTATKVLPSRQDWRSVADDACAAFLLSVKKKRVVHAECAFRKTKNQWWKDRRR
jgi:hypothetical protein